MEWHLDAWDRTGGRAFASMRPRNVELFDHDPSWGALIFIGPPSFAPEPIANTAIALNACRAGMFQPRVPFFGEEASFPSAEAVADFVRRAFVNGGTTRGGGGEGAPAVEGGPGDPPAGGDGERFARNDYLKQWTHAAEFLQDDHSVSGLDIQFNKGIAPRTKDGDEWRAVESGALQLIATMLSAFPGVEDRYRFVEWHASAVALYRALQEMDFWLEWKQGRKPLDLGPGWRLDDVVNNLLGAYRVIVDKNSRYHTPLFVAWLLSAIPAYLPDAKADTAKYLQPLINSAALGEFVIPVGESSGLRDRYYAMQLWPLPAYARQSSGLTDVGQLLMAFVSAPGSFAEGHPRLIDIVAFGAALMSSRLEDRRIDDWRERAADGWLAASMPKWIFQYDTEHLIMEGAPQRQFVQM